MKSSTARSLPPEPPPPQRRGSQQGFLFRLITAFANLQIGHHLRRLRFTRKGDALLVFLEGATALGILSVTAYLIRLPLLFPPLGPSAFILFRTPMAKAASPRSVFLSHATALLSGLVAVRLVSWLFPETAPATPADISWTSIGALALAMGLSSVAMITLRCSHPPAAATALIAAMGYITTWSHALGLLAAVSLLLAQAFIFNRIFSGLPYPRWRSDPAVVERFGSLAGSSDTKSRYWGNLTARILDRRS